MSGAIVSLVSASVLFQIDTLDCVVHCASFEVIDNEKQVHAKRTRPGGLEPAVTI